jgi:hypothetical protein
MSDGAGGAAADALKGDQGQGGGDAGAGAGAGGEGGGGDRWQDKFLGPELRGNETLANYKSIDDVGKALIETQAFARGRVAVPKAGDADFDTKFAEFAGKVRPEKAEDYKILDADGKPSEMGEAFRGIFYESGLHPAQAEKLTQAWNQHSADTLSKIEQAGKDEVRAIELDLGTSAFNQRVTAVQGMLKGVGIEIDDIVPAMSTLGGSAGKAVQALFKLAESTGELAKVDGVDVQIRMGTMTPQQAHAELDAMRARAVSDKEYAAKLGDPKSVEAQRRKAVQGMAAKQA